MKYKLFVLTILSSVAFFNYHYIFNDQLQKLLFYVNVLICLVWVLKDGISLRGVKYPRVPYFTMMVCIAFSSFMATAFHSQGLLVSVMTTLPFIFGYGYFWILMKMDIPNEKIMKTYLVFAGISTFVYMCNALTVPANIFGEPLLSMDMTRGIIRLPVVFIEFFPMLVFYAINKWLLTKEKKWLVVIAWISFMIFMAVIRQIIVFTAVLGLWFFFRKVNIWKKLALILVCLGIVIFVLPQIPMYKTMVELSEDQRDQNEDKEDVRILAWRYYTYENQTNALTPIFGNGIPSFGNSIWGKMMDSETEVNGTYAADVGWAGFFWYFGGIATVCLLVLLVRAYLRPKKPEEQYLNYWLVFVTITSVASGPLVYYWQILDIVVCLYMVYRPIKQEESEKVETDEKDSDNNSELQQLNRYPQLR